MVKEKKKLTREHHKTQPKNKKTKNQASQEPKPKKTTKTPKTKKSETEAKTKPKTQNKKDKEVFKKPGQKYQEPSLDDPTRAFYESLYEQKPESSMAQKYCLEHGLLPDEVTEKVAQQLKKK